MTKTSPRVSFGLYAMEIKPDSIPSASGLQTFSKLADLRTNNINPRPYATYEPNFWLLDGGYKFLPVNTATVHVGMMTTAQSNGSGVYTSPPVLTIDFGLEHTTTGLVLRFSQYSGDYANSINVKFYDASNNLLSNNNYTPNSTEFSTTFSELTFKKIVITFNGSSRPTRYLRLMGIDYGELIHFEDADVIEARIVEEISMVGTEAPMGTLELLLHSTDAQFSMLNPQGDFTALEQRQPFTVHEQIETGSIMMGQFYLNAWKNKSDTEINFEAVDLIGVLDTIPCRGGMWIGSGILIEDLIDDLLTPIYVPYDLDYDLVGTTLYGWLAAGTYREALQQIACAVGAFLTCSRSSVLRMVKSKIAAQASTWDAEITKAEKGDAQVLELKPLITGVDVTAHNYSTASGTETLYSGSLAAGVHEITFSSPMHSLSATGATITESGVNYAILTVASPGTVTLTGSPYQDSKRIYSARATIGAFDQQNILKITDATLVNTANGQAVADRVFDYHSQRHKQSLRLYAPIVEPGNIVLVDTLYDRQLLACIEKMDMDLAGGFIADVVLIGVDHGMG